MIIAISGKFCSGKDTIADWLVGNYGFRKVGFADKLKGVAADLFGMKEKDRSLLQALGEGMRQIRPSVWVDYVLHNIQPDEDVVINDVRYLNELKLIQAASGKKLLVRLECSDVIRLARYYKLYGYYPTVEQCNFISEVQLDSCHQLFDLILDTSQPPLEIAMTLHAILPSYLSTS